MDFQINPNKLINAAWLHELINIKKPKTSQEKGYVILEVCYERRNDAGHIPGVIWMGDWTQFVDIKNNTFKSLAELAKKWQELGITSDREPVFYCGTGWRSSIAFFISYLLGFKSVRNYDGGFFEWSWGQNRPISTG